MDTIVSMVQRMKYFKEQLGQNKKKKKIFYLHKFSIRAIQDFSKFINSYIFINKLKSIFSLKCAYIFCLNSGYFAKN